MFYLCTQTIKEKGKARTFDFDKPANSKTSKKDEENIMGASEKWGPKKPKVLRNNSILPIPKKRDPKDATYPLHGLPNIAQICWHSSSPQCVAHQDLVIESKYIVLCFKYNYIENRGATIK